MTVATDANTIPGSLIERLYYYAENNASHDAVVTANLTLSYAQLAQRVEIQAKALTKAGITNTSIIGIQCANELQHLLLCLASTSIGADSCTIPSHETDQLQNSLISRCGVTHIFDETAAINPAMTGSGAEVNHPGATPSDTATPVARLLFSTSGTTGEPKLVIHHDSDLVAQAHRHINSPQERFACLASMEHNFAKRHRLYCIAAGATNVFMNAEQTGLVEQCQLLKVNVLHVSAFQAQELLATPEINRLSHIRLKLGGSHVPQTLRQQLRDNITHNLQAGYGTTETGAIAFTDANDSNAGESVGQPLAGIEIRAVSAEKKPLISGKRGELAIRCKGMFRGYLDKPELTATRLREGWFYTGDIGYLDKQQRIYLCGRSDDMFVFNSMNIYPQDIESVIRQFPGISDAVVLPKTSSVHGNIPVALVVFTKGVKQNLAALKKFVQKEAGVRSPRQYIIVTEIPTNASGKISRRDAIKLPEKSNHIRSDIINLLDEKILKQLKPALISAFINGDEDIAFSDIGMDSLARMDFLIALETEYNVIITPRELGDFRYLGNIVARIITPPLQAEFQPEDTPQPTDLNSCLNQAGDPPYLLRFFQRIAHHCHTAAQLNKALSTLDHRLTPLDVENLHNWHWLGLLIPAEAENKFQTAISQWLKETRGLMLKSGKQHIEPFLSQRITATATHFHGPGSANTKTLVICFPPAGLRHMQIHNTVLMQHTDATRFDLLILSEPLNEGYRRGIPAIGSSQRAVIKWLAEQDWIKRYLNVRTLGFSAGCYPAVVAAYSLQAEMAVSISGRFHKKKKHTLKNLDKVITTWRAAHSGHRSQLVLSYATDNSRDRKYANIIKKLAGGRIVAVESSQEKIGHLVLPWLLEHGELTSYLAATIFSDIKSPSATEQRQTVMRFPSRQ